MCEIAVIDPEQVPIQIAHNIASRFDEEQGDGLGVVAVKNNGDVFEYDTYKSVKPHWQTLYAYFKRNYDDAWRFVIHGRNKTAGDVNREGAHPINIDCEKCEFDYVVHNGSVRNHRNIRPSMEESGHNFNTEVDSEIIAHKISELPESVDDHHSRTYSMRGNLNYLVFSENGILVRATTKYALSDSFTMTCSIRSFDDAEELGFDAGASNEWMLIEPSDDGPEIETKERVVRSSSGNYDRSAYRTGGANTRGGWPTAGVSQSQQKYVGDDDGTYTIEYQDLSDWEHIIAIQVAPSVIKVIDENQGKEEYIHRDKDPRLFYWYADMNPPENIDQLEAMAGSDDYTEADIEFIVKRVRTAMASEMNITDEHEDGYHLNLLEAAERGVEEAFDNEIKATHD